jgi:hypothetical protein
MPPHQHLERRLIALFEEALQELANRHSAAAAATDKVLHVLQNAVRGHVDLPCSADGPIY